MKLKDLPPPSHFYKDPETLEPEDKDKILNDLKEIAARYRLARSKLSVEKKEEKKA